MFVCKEEMTLVNSWNGQYLGEGGKVHVGDRFSVYSEPTPKKKFYKLMYIGKFPYMLQIRKNDLKRYFEEVKDELSV